MFQEPQPQSPQQPAQSPTALFDVVPKEIPYVDPGMKGVAEMLRNEEAIQQASFNAALRSFQETGKDSPELVAFRRSQRLAGLPEPTDAQEMQKYTDMQRVNLATMQKESPVLFERLKDYENAELLRRDTAAWSMGERIAGSTKRGQVEDEYGKLSFKRNYFKLSEDEETQYQQLKKQLQILPSPNGNWIAAAGKMLGQMYNMGPETVAWAAAGGLLGSLAGPGGTAAGAYWGTSLGTAKQTFMTEAGSVVQDMIDQGYDPDAAKTAGLFHGALSTALTAGVFGVTTASLRSAVRGAISPTVLTKLGMDPAKKMLFGNFTKMGAVGRYAGGVIAEDFEEVGQEVSAVLAERLAGAISKEEYQQAIQTAQGTQSIAERIAAVAIETFQGMTLLGLPGLALDVSATNSRRSQAESRAQALMNTIDLTRGTDVSRLAPDAYSDQVAELAEKNGMAELVLNRKQFDEAMAALYARAQKQDASLKQSDFVVAIRDRFPDLAKQLDAADKTGADIRISVADVALMARGEFGLHTELLKRGRIVDEGMDGDTGISWEEAQKQRMVAEQLRTQSMSIQARRGQKYVKQYDQVRRDIERKLEVVPQYTGQQRRFLAQVTADYYAVRAERMGTEGAPMSIIDAYKQDEFTITGPKSKGQQIKFAEQPAPVVQSPQPTVTTEQPKEAAPAQPQQESEPEAAPQAEEEVTELVAPESLKFQQDSQRQSITKQLFDQESAASKTPLSTAAAKRLQGVDVRQEELVRLEADLKTESERVRGLTREAYLEELEQDLDKAKTLLEGMDRESDEYKNLLAWAQYTNNYLLQEQAKEQQIEPAVPEVEPEVAPEQAADPVIPTVEQIAEEVLQAAEEEIQQVQEQQQQQEQEAAPLKLFVDGVEGTEVPWQSVPNGSDAWQYAIGKIEEDGKTAVWRRKASERGTYGGWRYELEPSKLISQKKQQDTGWTRKPGLDAWDKVPGQGNPNSLGTGYISGKHNDNIAARAKERGDIGLLITPLIPSYVNKTENYGFIAVDNGVFSKTIPFSESKFRKLVETIAANPSNKSKTLFVVAPDVVGDAAATLAKFPEWAAWIKSQGLPVALAAQDGLENMMDQIQWDLVDVLFIGGSTDWKIGKFDSAEKTAAWGKLFVEAQNRGIPIHMGRVNTNERIAGPAQQVGAGTVDGTYLAYGPDQNLPKLEGMLDRLNKLGLDLDAQMFPELGRAPTDQELYDVAFDEEIKTASDLGAFEPALKAINAIRMEYGFEVIAANKQVKATEQKPKKQRKQQDVSKYNAKELAAFLGQEGLTELQREARKLAVGKITRDQWDATVARLRPVKEFAEVPSLTTVDAMMKVGRLDKTKIAKVDTIKDGMRVALRLDIPSWQFHKTWVVAVHEATKGGSANVRGPFAYTNAVAINNVTFASREQKSFDIAQAKTTKDWTAVVNGDKQPMTAEEVQAMAKEVLNSPEWVQVGFNPEIHSYFWDRKTGEPIDKAEMVLQVGPLVLAKNPVYGKKSEKLFSRATATPPDGYIKGIRYTVGGKGLMNNQVLNRSKLSDDEEFELIELMDFGLQQPRDLDAGDVFYFTESGNVKHKRLISLLKKAAIGKVTKTEVWVKPKWTDLNGDQVSATETLPIGKDTLRSRATASNDAAYLDAVNRGDMKAAQEMVDAAAKAAGFNEDGEHGLALGVLEGGRFDPSMRGKNTGAASASLGFFFGSEKTARAYGQKTLNQESSSDISSAARSAFADVFDVVPPGVSKDLDFERDLGDEAFSADSMDELDPDAFVERIYRYANEVLDDVEFNADEASNEAEVLQAVERARNALDRSIGETEFESVTDVATIRVKLRMRNPLIHDQKGQKYRDKTYYDIIREAQANGHDSVIIKNTYDGGPLDDIKVVFSPDQIKSSDVVTRGDDGNVISLSQRFQAESPDIRYSRTADIAGTVNLSTMEITLTKDATFSTFLHEMSHIWLHMLMRDAQTANVPQQIVADAQTLLKWFGLKSFDEWNALSPEDRAVRHERWAYNFEGFISGEEAPSRELRGIFRQFRRWLTQAWTNIRTRLNLAYRQELQELGKPVEDLPILTTEVAEVMNRMLATDEQIALNQDFQSLMSLHMTKEQWLALGNTEAEWLEILRLQSRMGGELTDELTEQTIRGMEWLSSKNMRMLRAHKEKVDKQRNEIAKRIQPEIERKRVHQARALIRTGKMTNGETAAVIEMSESRLNLKMVRELFKDEPENLARVEAELGTGKTGMLYSKGVDPDQLATVLGYSDAKSMVMELLNAPTLETEVSELVDAEMKAQYKHLLDPKKIQKEISAQLSSKMRQKMVAIELRGLDRNLRKESDAGQPQLMAEMQEAQKELESLLNTEKSFREERDALRQKETDIKKQITKEKRKPTDDGARMTALQAELSAVEGQNKGRLAEINSNLKQLNKHIRKAERLAEGPRTTVATIMRAAQEVAIELIGKTLVKDALPSYFEANARMRRRGTTQALARGQSLEAIEQKRGELTQAAMAEQATAFQQEMDSFKELIQDMFRMSRADMAKSRDFNMAIAARGVAAAFGFGTEKQVEAVTEAVKAMRIYAPELATQVEQLLSEATQQATKISQQAQKRGAAAGRSKRNRVGPLYRELTVEQMQQLMDRIKGLWNRSADERVVELGGQKRSVEEVSAALTAKVLDRMDKPVGAGKSASGIMSYAALASRAEHVMEHLDGQQVGEWQLLVYRWVKDNAVKARGEFAQKIKQLSGILANIDMRHGQKIVATELGGHVFGEDPNNPLISELLHVVLHMGNPENLEKLVMGKTRVNDPQQTWGKYDDEGNLDTTDLRNFIERMIKEKVLTEQHFKAAEQIFELMDQLTPGAIKAFYRVNGYNMKLVKHGQIVNSLGTFRGGYVPAAVDKDATPIGDIMELKAQANEQFTNGMPKARDGFTKERVKKGALPRVTNINSLPMHIRDVLFYTHLQPILHDLSKVFTQEDLQGALNAYDPAIMRNVFIPWMGRTVRQLTQTPTNNPLDKIVRRIRRNVGLDKLALSLNVMFQQFTGLSVSSTRVPKAQLAKALVIWGKDPKAARKFISDLSPAMAEKFDNQMTEMMNQLEEVVRSPNAYKNFQKWALNNGMVLQAGAQNIVDSITWIGAFNEAMEKKGRGLSIEEAQKIAAADADSIVRLTQGGSFAEDLSTAEAGTVWAQLFTQFQTVFIVMMNAAGWKARTLVQDMGMLRASPRVMGLVFFGLYLPLAIGNLISETMRGEIGDDEDMDGVSETWFRTLVLAPLSGVAGGLPQIGAVANLAINSFDNKRYNDRLGTTPVFGAFEASRRGLASVYDLITDPGREIRGQDVKDWATFIAMISGIPTSVLARPTSYMLDEDRGFYSSRNSYLPEFVEYTRGLATGTGVPTNR